jgi:DNA-binding XRE family transcriptional regulator
VEKQLEGVTMNPQEIRALREHLQLTQEVFASILGVSFATVNRWENEKTMPTGDYARVLQTLGQLTAYDALGPMIDWRRVGALSAMAAVAGFSPLLTLGAALAPVLIAHLSSWSEVPLGGTFTGHSRPRPEGKNTTVRKRDLPQPSVTPRIPGKTKDLHPSRKNLAHIDPRRTGG